MDSPLDTSRTAVDNHDISSDYFQRRLASDDIITEDNIDRVISRINSQVPSKKSGKRDQDGFVEHDLELQSLSSNETITPGLSANNDKDAMYALDAGLDFPEGGLKAYSVLFGCFIGLIPNFGLLNVVGVIQTNIAENQLSDVKSSTISWIFSLFLFVNFITSIFSGTFFDRNGARIPLTIGTVLQVAGLVATANCTKVWHFILAFGVLTGIGGGTAISPLVGSVAHYFNRKRGFMVSIASTGGSVGGIVFPMMLRKLFVEVGYIWAIRIFALVFLFCYGIAIVLVEERLPQKKSEGTRLQKLASYLSAIDITGLKDFKYLFTVLGCAFAEAAALIIATYHVSYARANGCSESTAYLMISISHVGGIVGRWFTGYLSDHVGRFNVMILTLLGGCLVLLIVLIPFGNKHVEAVYVFSVAWGFTTGSIFSLLPVCCGQISKTEEFGRRYGTMYFVVAFGSLVCIPIAGAIIGDESQVGYRNMILYAAVTAFCSSVFYVVARVYSVGGVIKKKF